MLESTGLAKLVDTPSRETGQWGQLSRSVGPTRLDGQNGLNFDTGMGTHGRPPLLFGDFRRRLGRFASVLMIDAPLQPMCIR